MLKNVFISLVLLSFSSSVFATEIAVTQMSLFLPVLMGVSGNAASESLVSRTVKKSSQKTNFSNKKNKVKRVKRNQSRTKFKKRSRRKSKGKRGRRCSFYASPQYKKMVRNWRKKPRIKAPKYRAGYRDLVLYSVNLGERIRVFPFLPNGALDPEALKKISHLLRDKHTHVEHAVDPRLVKLLYKIAVRFKAPQITVISGFREKPPEKKTESHHSDGTAVDFLLPGTSLPIVAKVARQFGRVGVGFYPVSGFVHLDVRKKSFFWVDRSGPGKASCLAQIMPKAGWKWDARWKAENDEPKIQKNRKGEVKGALKEVGSVESDVAKDSTTDDKNREDSAHLFLNPTTSSLSKGNTEQVAN